MSPSLQARSLATRARLLEAGRVAFSRRGHDGVNLTTDILAPAGVSAGSFYHQFVDKTDLLLAILDEAASERKATVFGGGHDDGSRRSFDIDVAEAIERFFVSLDDEGHLWRIQLRERDSSEPRIRQRVLDGRRAWQQEVARLLSPHNRRGDAALAQAVELVNIFGIGLIAAYLDLPPEVRSARRAALPQQVSEFLCRGVRPLLGIPQPRKGKRVAPQEMKERSTPPLDTMPDRSRGSVPGRS